nr:ribonuclease H-like domain-containing protein [Tanacetum cinerariifolium]
MLHVSGSESDSDDESWGDSEDESDDINDDDSENEDDDGNDAHDSERTNSNDVDENPSFTLKDMMKKNMMKKKSYEQVVEDAHVTLTSSQKTKSSKQSSSVSSDFAKSSTQAPSLCTVPETAISKTYTTRATTVPPTISMIAPLPQLTTPSLTPKTVPTTTSIPALPDFSSLFGFDQSVSTLETELSQLKQAGHSTQHLESVKSQLPKMVDDLLDVVKKSVKDIIKDEVKSLLPQILPKEVSEFATPMIQSTINESLENVILAKSSSQPKSTYKTATSLMEFELKKILLDKIEKSKSYQAAPKHRELYDVLKRKTSKEAEPPKGSKSKESKTSSSKGTKSQPKSSGNSVQAEELVFETADTEMPQDHRGNTEDQPNVEVNPTDDWFKKPNKPLIPDRAWNDGKSVDSRPPQKWISNISKARQLPRTFDKLMSTLIDFSAYVMHNLKIDNLTQEILVGHAFNLLKVTFKSFVELEYHFEECYKAVTDQLDWNNLESHEYPFDLSKPLSLIKAQGLQVVPADYFFNNNLKYLKGGSSSRKYTTSITKTKAAKYDNTEGIEDMVLTLWSPVKVAYDKFAMKRIIEVTHVKVMKWYDYVYLEEIIVRREDQTLHKFKEGHFPRLNLHDTEDLLLFLVQKKLSNLEKDVIFDLNVALRMFTRRIVILKRVEDLQLGVESYPKKLNITKPETFRSDISKMTPYTAYKNPEGGLTAQMNFTSTDYHTKEELRSKGIKSPSKLLSLKYLSQSDIIEQNKNPSSLKLDKFVNLIIILNKENEAEEEGSVEPSKTNYTNSKNTNELMKKLKAKRKSRRKLRERPKKKRNITRNTLTPFPLYTTSVIDHYLGSVVFEKPFVEATGLVYNKEEGTVVFERDKYKIVFKMPHKMDMFKHIDFTDISTDRIPLFSVESDDDNCTKTHYSDSLELGPEYKYDECVYRGIVSTVSVIVNDVRERKARTTLLMALPEDHLAKFHKMADAKEMWEAIKSRFSGNDESKKMQKYLLKQQFEGTTVSSSNIQNVAFVSAKNTSSTNDVSTAYSVSSPLVLKSQKEGSSSYTDEDDSKALVTIDGEDIDWSGHVKEDAQNYAMMAYSSSNSGSDNEAETGESKIIRLEMEQETTKVVVIKERLKEAKDQTCSTFGKKGELAPRLRKIHSKGLTSDYPIWQVIQNGNGHVSVITYTNGIIKVLPPKTAEEVVARERERKARATLLMALPEDHLAKFHKMADTKEMWKAIKSRFEDIDWSRHVEEDAQNYAMMAYFSSNSGSDNESVFMNKTSDLEDTLVNDRFADGMHAVPPPMTGNYMPFGPDVETNYSKFTYGPKQTSADESDSKPSEYASCESNSSVETSTSMHEPVENASKVVYEPKVWTDALIIEECESDSDNNSVSNVQEDKEKPSFAFTDSVKHVKTSRENIKETCTTNHSPKIEKHDRNGHTRKGLGYAFTKKQCFVCGSFSHLIRDCDLHEKRMAKQAQLTKRKNKEGSSPYTDEVIHSFFANQSSAPQLDYDNLEQINDDDMEEMDLKWQVVMISIKIKKFYKRTSRKLQFDTKDPVSFDKTKVECFNCHKIGHFARDCKAKGNQDNRRRDVGYNENKTRDNDAQNYAMMAYSSSNSGSNNEVKSCSKACEESYARLKKLYDDQRDKLGDASVEITAYTLTLKKVEA